jgi:hypothetical protein
VNALTDFYRFDAILKYLLSFLGSVPQVDAKGATHSIGGGSGVTVSKNAGSGSSALRSFETNDRIIGGPLRGKQAVKAERKVAVVKKLSLQEQMLADAAQCRADSSDAIQSMDAVSSSTGSACRRDHLLELEAAKPLLSAVPTSLLNIARKQRPHLSGGEAPSFSLEGLEISEGPSIQLLGGVGGIEELD